MALHWLSTGSPLIWPPLGLLSVSISHPRLILLAYISQILLFFVYSPPLSGYAHTGNSKLLPCITFV